MKLRAWKRISDWPTYEISDDGLVRRGERIIKTFFAGEGRHHYLAFNVSDRKRRASLRLHREVAKAFLPGTGIVRHLNGNTSDCTSANLAWGNHKDNEADKKRHGRSLEGERHHQHKLSTENILEIRASTERPIDLARRFGVSYHTIWDIQAFKTWLHV